jgi:exonuclease 3'-5' domain-containing protein 1
VAPQNTTYIVDIFKLGSLAFSTVGHDGISLKSILENKEIPKVFFDIRNDSDVLYSRFQISVNCIIDMQVLELANRSGSIKLVNGLAKCIENYAVISADAKRSWKT